MIILMCAKILLATDNESLDPNQAVSRERSPSLAPTEIYSGSETEEEITPVGGGRPTRKRSRTLDRNSSESEADDESLDPSQTSEPPSLPRLVFPNRPRSMLDLNLILLLGVHECELELERLKDITKQKSKNKKRKVVEAPNDIEAIQARTKVVEIY